MLMPFGKYRGRPLRDIPESYLRWVLQHCDAASPSLLSEIRQILNPPTMAISSDVVGQWYRKMSLEYHPDRHGGNGAGMKVVNRCRDVLVEMLDKVEHE